MDFNTMGNACATADFVLDICGHVPYLGALSGKGREYYGTGQQVLSVGLALVSVGSLAIGNRDTASKVAGIAGSYFLHSIGHLLRSRLEASQQSKLSNALAMPVGELFAKPLFTDDLGYEQAKFYTEPDEKGYASYHTDRFKFLRNQAILVACDILQYGAGFHLPSYS